MLFVLLLFVCVSAQPLLKNVLVSRPSLTALNITAEGIGFANRSGSQQKAWFAWADTNIDTTDINSFKVVEPATVSYGPSEWSTNDGWIVQTAEVVQLIVNPVSLAVAKSPYQGSFATIGEEAWSDLVLKVKVRSETLDAHSTGVAWRYVDIDNHYMFVINVDCAVAKLVRVRNKNVQLLGAGPVNVLAHFNFGAAGNHPTLTDISEFAYAAGTKLNVCQGNCQSDTDCLGGLICAVVGEDDTKIPGCAGEITEGWRYCTVTRSRPPEDASTLGFLTLNSGSLNGANNMGQCTGDCDVDRDCLGNLICLLRDETTPIPGCNGAGTAYWDYCGRERVDPTFTTAPGPTDFLKYDGYVLEFRNKDSLKTSDYIIHVETSSGCDADADSDILGSNYNICAWVKVGVHYNGVSQVLASAFYNKQELVGHTSTLPHCTGDTRCQLQIDSVRPFQQRDQWHHVCDTYQASGTPITSIDIFIGYPVLASQGYMLVTGVSVDRRSSASHPDMESLPISGMTNDELLNFKYDLRITHVGNDILVVVNDKDYIRTTDTSPLALSNGKIGLFSGGNKNIGYKNLEILPVRGYQSLEGPNTYKQQLSLEMPNATNGSSIGTSIVLIMQGCPPPSSVEACGDIETYGTAPPDPPRFFRASVIDNAGGIQLTFKRPLNSGGSPLTHYNVSYRPANRSASAQVSYTTFSADDNDALVGNVASLIDSATVPYLFRAVSCSLVGCGQHEVGALYETGAPSVPQNISLVVYDTSSLQFKFGLPAQSGGTPTTHFKGSIQSTICLGLVRPSQSTWKVTWDNGVASVAVDATKLDPTLFVVRNTKNDLKPTGWIIDGPRGPNSAINTEVGTGVQILYNGNEGYRVGDGDFSINAVTRGPFTSQASADHTLARGRNKDHWVYWNANQKLGWFRDEGGGHLFIDPVKTMLELFEGGEANIWKYWTIISRGGTIEMWLDGVYLGKTAGQKQSADAGIYWIGGYHDNHNQRWGPLAEFSFYDYALSEEEMKGFKCPPGGIETGEDVFNRASIQNTNTLDSLVVNTGNDATAIPHTAVVQACNTLGCGPFASVQTQVPGPIQQVILKNQGKPSDNLLVLEITDGETRGNDITSYKVKYISVAPPLIHTPCDEFTDGAACIKTTGADSGDTCKENGLNIVIPRNRDHWVFLLANYDPYVVNILPGITKNKNGGNYQNYAFNSDDLPKGPDEWRALDDGPFWVRATKHRQPDGDYRGKYKIIDGWMLCFFSCQDVHWFFFLFFFTLF